MDPQIFEVLHSLANSTNSTPGPPDFLTLGSPASHSPWGWESVLKTVAISLIVCGTIIGNGFVLLVMLLSRDKHLRSSTHYFITNLACADFLIGVSCLPFKAIWTISGVWYFGQLYCKIWTNLHFWLCSASILSVCAICVDRYIGVRYPLKHYRLMNKCNVIWMSGTVWATALILSAVPLAVWPEPESATSAFGGRDCKTNQQVGHVLIASVGILYIPTIVMFVLYGKIYLITRQHFKNLQNGFPNLKNNDDFQVSLRLDGSIEDESTATTITQIGGICTYSNGLPGSGPEMKELHTSSSENVAQISVDQNETATAGLNNPRKESVSANSKPNASIQLFLKKTSNHANSKQNRLNLHRNRQVQVAKRLGFIVGIFLISYIPYFTVFLIRGLNPDAISKDVFIMTSWIRYLNSFLNPIIYAAMIPAFRKSFMNLISCSN